jgi:hypothetical protein
MLIVTGLSNEMLEGPNSKAVPAITRPSGSHDARRRLDGDRRLGGEGPFGEAEDHRVVQGRDAAATGTDLGCIDEALRHPEPDGQRLPLHQHRWSRPAGLARGAEHHQDLGYAQDPIPDTDADFVHLVHMYRPWPMSGTRPLEAEARGQRHQQDGREDGSRGGPENARTPGGLAHPSHSTPSVGRRTCLRRRPAPRQPAGRRLPMVRPEGYDMSFAIYLIGFVIILVGVAWGMSVAGVQTVWIGIVMLVLLGIGIISGVSRTRSKDPPEA